MELPLPPPGSASTPPSGSGIISRPLSISPIIPPLIDWQAVPFEIMNPSLTATPGGAFAASLNFRRCDQDLMFQTHPSLYAPMNSPFAGLPEPGDAMSLYPLTPESGSDANGDALTVAEDRHSLHGLLSETERSPSNSDTNSPGSNDKNSFWNTVLSPSPHGRSNSAADVLEFIPATRPEIVPVPPMPSPRKTLHLFSVEEFGQPSLLTKLPVLDTPNHEEKPPDQLKQKQEKNEVQQGKQERQDRPYECNQCGLRFRKRCNAINHTKIVRKSPFHASWHLIPLCRGLERTNLEQFSSSFYAFRRETTTLQVRILRSSVWQKEQLPEARKAAYRTKVCATRLYFE